MIDGSSDQPFKDMVALCTSPSAGCKSIKKGKHPCCHFVAARYFFSQARESPERPLFAIFLLLPEDLMDQESNAFGVLVRQRRRRGSKNLGLNELHEAPPRATAGKSGGDIWKQTSAERAEQKANQRHQPEL
jgi:hypothetical protein